MAATLQATATTLATFQTVASGRNANDQGILEIVGDQAKVTMIFDTVEDLNRFMVRVEDAKQAMRLG